MFDESRLRRAGQRAKVRLGPQQCSVAGKSETLYYVDLTQHPPCTCADAHYRERDCLHTLACRMLCGDVDVLVAYGELLQRDGAET